MNTATLDAQQRIALPNPSSRAARLDALGPAGRVAAYRAGELDFSELTAWFVTYPEEVPTINGEFE